MFRSCQSVAGHAQCRAAVSTAPVPAGLHEAASKAEGAVDGKPRLHSVDEDARRVFIEPKGGPTLRALQHSFTGFDDTGTERAFDECFFPDCFFGRRLFHEYGW